MARRGHGEGSIYQRKKDGRWTGFIPLEGGKRKFFYGETRAEVAKQVNKALADKEQGLLVTGPNQTVAQYLNRWLEDSARQSVRPRTYECYVLAVKRVLPHIGKVRLPALTPAQVQKTYAALLEGGLSRRTVELTHSVLHHAFRQAVLWNMTGRNPTEAVAVPRPARKEMQTLSHVQVQHLFATSREDRLSGLWVLLATTGLRVGEALGLKWADLDFAANKVKIQRALQSPRAEHGFLLVEPKTERSRRTVVAAASTMAALKEHRRRQLEERLVAGPLWEDMDLVFATPTGGPLNATSTVTKAFQRALIRAELPRIRLHDLRHTAATLLLAEGENPKVVQEILGHGTIVLTLDTYSHVTPMMHDQAAEKMETLFGNAN